MGNIIVVGEEKGGSTKTTTLTNLAAWLAQQGHDVIVLDTDKQATASNFIARRNAAIANGDDLPVIHCAQKTGEIYQTAIDLAHRYEYVLIDVSGRDSAELRQALVAADRLLMPLQASIADIETLGKMDELIKLARPMNPRLTVRAMIARAPNNPSGDEVSDARAFLADFPDIPLMRSLTRDRKIYRTALLEGRGVVEMKDARARAEIQLLAAEFFGDMIDE